jgi:hypothetical protein
VLVIECRGLLRVAVEGDHAAMISMEAFAGDELCLEIDFSGRPPLARRAAWTLEMSGRHLAYQIKLDNGWLFFRACEMDGAKWHQILNAVVANTDSWDFLKGLLAALEREQIRDLETRPLQIGPVGPSGYVIA